MKIGGGGSHGAGHASEGSCLGILLLDRSNNFDVLAFSIKECSPVEYSSFNPVYAYPVSFT